MKKLFKKIVNVFKDVIQFAAKVILWILGGIGAIVALVMTMVLFPLVAIFNAIGEGETVKETFDILCKRFIELINDNI